MSVSNFQEQYYCLYPPPSISKSYLTKPNKVNCTNLTVISLHPDINAPVLVAEHQQGRVRVQDGEWHRRFRIILDLQKNVDIESTTVCPGSSDPT